jgi:hypothetical protein
MPLRAGIIKHRSEDFDGEILEILPMLWWGKGDVHSS